MVAPALGAETLTVTQDHLELRNEPRAADETFLSTVRKGTTVEWTGKTSGDWFEVQAPNGQVGWVHKSGISAPQIAPKPTPKPATTEPSSGTRSIAATASVTALEKKIKDLEKTTSQYKMQLEEKEKRVGELVKELKNLEQKISEQPPNDQAALADLQQRIDTLNAAVLFKTQELTVVQDQLAQLQTKLSRKYPLPTLISYGANGVLFLGLCLVGLLYIRSQRHADGEAAIEETPPLSPVVEPPRVQAPEPVIITAPRQHTSANDKEKMVIKLVETPSATSGADIIEADDIEELDEREGFIEPDIIEELDELEKVEDVEEVEDIEDVEEISEVERIEDVQDVEEIEDRSEHETIELVEDLAPEDIEAIEDVAEVEDLVEELESPVTEDIAVELILEDFPEPDASPQYPSHTDTLYAELEELENYLDEGEGYPVGQLATAIEREYSTNVDVSGETFEMLVNHSTQIIAPEEEEYLEEEFIEEVIEEDVEEIEEIEEIEEKDSLLEQGTLVEELEEIEEINDETNFETEAEHLFEPEEPPRFLEPSPILIEPEYEPAEVFNPPPQTFPAQESRYDIELVGVGKNKEQLLGLLSKIQGLPQSPQELVNTIPSLIARGAKEQDAKNFQMVMQKLGAEIRLIKK